MVTKKKNNNVRITPEGLQSINPLALLKPNVEPTLKPVEQTKSDGIRRGEDGGIISVTKEGKEFFIPASERENVAQIEARRAGRGLLPSVELPTLEQQKQQMENQQLALNVGQTNIGQVEKDKLDLGQAIKSSLATAGAGAAGSAVAGAVGGSVVPGVGTTIGAGIGAVAGAFGGFLLGFKSNLKTQRKDMLTGEAADLMKQEQNLLKIVQNTNKGGDAMRNYQFFQEQIFLIDEQHARLKLEITDKPSKWLGEDGHIQMEKYEVFNSPGGMREILTFQMQQALLNPDPNKDLLGVSDIINSETENEQ